MLKSFIPFLFLVGLFPFMTLSQCPFPPAAGQPGTGAIPYDSDMFVGWANRIEVKRGYINIADTNITFSGSNRADFGEPDYALGASTANSNHVVSLGDGGMATLQFDRPIINGPGPDFAVFENGFSDGYLELAFVEVSTDGERFVRFPSVSHTQTHTQTGGFGILDPTCIHNLAGKYRVGFGTPFDLEDLADSTGIDLNNIRFVRIIDVVGCIDCGFQTHDARGTIINDPWPTPFHSGGFDLEAVGIINGGEPYGPTAISVTQRVSARAFPNPFSGSIYIEAQPGSTIQLYDNLGRMQREDICYDGSIILENISPGWYILRITNAHSTETFKLLGK